MIIHFEKNGEQFEGEISEDVYYDKIFPIFRDHLSPVEQKKFYTLDQVKEKSKLIESKKHTNIIMRFLSYNKENPIMIPCFAWLPIVLIITGVFYGN